MSGLKIAFFVVSGVFITLLSGIVGLTLYRAHIVNELTEVAEEILKLNQKFQIEGVEPDLKRIDRLDLPEGIRDAMKTAGIVDVDDLKSKTTEQLTAIPGIDAVAVNLIDAAIRKTKRQAEPPQIQIAP